MSNFDIILFSFLSKFTGAYAILTCFFNENTVLRLYARHINVMELANSTKLLKAIQT